MESFTAEKDVLIRKISEASKMAPFSDFLLDFLEYYGLFGLNDATVNQLEEYIDNSNINEILREAPRRRLF